ncbi:MAG TPA: DUF2157 domain-containing protein [Gemmatimonadales bacterium]|nr:DUF2157 domain-containing protein [Gemmatimonadales bacterium]
MTPDQRRASAILAFREELARLEAEGVVLDAATKSRIQAHHDALLETLASRGDVDLVPGAARLSMGMRIATLLGTIALSAAYALFVSSHWGRLGLGLQLALVIAPPLLLIALTHVAAQHETSGYVASLLATVAVIAFAVNLGTLGALFNLPDSRNALLAVGLLGLLLAYRYGLTLPLLPGIGGVGGWLWSLGAIPLGLWWRDGFLVIEPLLGVGVAAMTVPAWVRGTAGFAPWWRGTGGAALILGLLILGSNGQLSMFAGGVHTIEIVYKIVGAVALSALIAWGIRRDQRIVMQIGTAGAVLYLFLRLVDWFWDWVPQWLFFLIVGAFALAVLFVLRRLHRRMAAR